MPTAATRQCDHRSTYEPYAIIGNRRASCDHRQRQRGAKLVSVTERAKGDCWQLLKFGLAFARTREANSDGNIFWGMFLRCGSRGGLR